MASSSSSSVLVLFILLITLITNNVEAKKNHSTSNLIRIGSNLTPDALGNSSWLSYSGRFAFGFYPQGNGFAVGIQLLNPPQNTVVWTANRDDPPVSSNSTLKLTKRGLLLQTEGGPEVTIASGSSSEEEGTSGLEPEEVETTAAAAMLDSGNFVLYNGTSFVIWESFSLPTDTILGGQDLEAGRSLVSSASVSDHSRGPFSLTMNSNGNLLAYPPNSSAAYYLTAVTSLTEYCKLSLNMSGFLVIENELGGKAIQILANGSHLQDNQTTVYRATLDADGNFRLYLHSFLMASVAIIWSAFHPCDIQGICGFNSYCEIIMQNEVECKCYPGFVYNNASQKSLGCYHNFTVDGCTEDEEPRLRYKVEALDNIWWKNHPYSVTPSQNKEDCSDSCLGDCNCWAVLYNSTDANCRKYKIPLLYGKRNSSKPSKGYIKLLQPRNMEDTPFNTPDLPESPTVTESKNNSLILILAISLGSIAFLCFVFAISSFTTYMHRVHRYEKLLKDSSLALADPEYFTLQSFSYAELERATDGFKEEIGRGTFGAVYKGTLSGGSSSKTVAVKRLEKVVDEGVREFRAEITTIGRTHHRNLVQLLGFCIEGSRKLLVYDYMSNGSLADLLFKAKTMHSSWNERVRLVFDVAKGVLYLHDECSVHIIHSNLKPQNILLDHTWTAKISDFGLARLVPNETKISSATGGGMSSAEQVRRGYLAPEWQNNALISVKADIYSFGIVLLEIVCCRRNIEVNISTPDEIILSSWVSKCFAAGELAKLVEEDENVDLKTLERMVKVGLWCVQDDPALRPFMRNVILMLEGTMDIPVPPCPKLPSLV
ncbi:G-type lectin S-receptor-like serine/threonine-protein kinase LECRK3 [Argentina anserina]|uniref:G-type lectin S-receptor-like serine/threonine-protein kinase LECRK3 n=1 Tax=Argentina anserina TaxID=57926 RepID=UPI00217683AD|nr:G-type lectin S-receptor-like serine/threonine-protein kinase LECRK3 [Potentilla anserina]